MNKYELHIHYKNGETDDYYSRLTGKYWESDAVTAKEALEEMMDIDPETFAAIDECENVKWYIVAGPIIENVNPETKEIIRSCNSVEARVVSVRNKGDTL